VNVLAHGTKRWALWPPHEATYAKEPAADRWHRLHRHIEGSSSSSSSSEEAAARGGGAEDPIAPLECVQEAGDVLFVPTLWGHATLNERQAIGTAYEFSLEPFCME
jgi:hypothetical protein